MNHKLYSTIALAALMAAPTVAYAQDESGWYLRGNAGYGVHTDIDITGDVVGDVESEGNAAGSVGLGYDFGNNWRLEGDFAQLQTDLGAISQYPNTSAKLETKTAMINAIYDFSGFGRWEPYIGAGIGIVRGNATIQASDFPSGSVGAPGVVNVSNPTCVGGVACSFKDGDTGLGWQLLAGVGYAISDNLTWDTHYRYLNSTNLDFKGAKAPALGSLAAAAASYEDVGAHALMTGFRYRFGEKAAAAPVVLPVAPAGYTCWDGSMVMESYECPSVPASIQCWDGTMVSEASQCATRPTYTCSDGTIVYDQNLCVATRSQEIVGDLCAADRMEMIFYDFNKGRSAETEAAVNRILDIGQYCNVDNFHVVGHTDTSGSAAYNLALSKRRAADVRKELVKQGVDSSRITSEGVGETQPWMQTGDNVKEPLNRRAEVTVRLSSNGGILLPN
ncbi:MAG: outer membrane beta-barrel protein [Maricaulaceae bacterium]